MEPLLFLVHRLPYPPNKGDKIRSFNILKHLASRFDVHLGTLMDDPADARYIPRLSEICASVKVCRLRPRAKRLWSLAALGTGRPFGLGYFYERELQRWVTATLASQPVRKVLVFSSTMAQYVLPRPPQCLVMACDMVDLDSMKWLQYSQRVNGLMRAVYRRESRCLAAYERQVVTAFNRTSFVSEQESALFLRDNQDLGKKVLAFGNGVDLDYFDPSLIYPDPYPRTVRAVAFTGAMDYWPNADAVSWYAHTIHPLVRAQCPNAHFYIVGSNPIDEVIRLGQLDGVTVTGGVEDIRPYLQHASCIVAPLRIARGVQNKVLEALAMNKSIVATHDALVGIDCGNEVRIPTADDARAFGQAVLAEVERHARGEAGDARRKVVMSRFSWAATLARLDTLLQQEPAA